jgi:hypothetical protein
MVRDALINEGDRVVGRTAMGATDQGDLSDMTATGG